MVKTAALSLTWMSPSHQELVERITSLGQAGLNCRQIADQLNDLGVTSKTGKRFYPELVFGVLRKAGIRSQRSRKTEVTAIRCELVERFRMH